MAYLIGVLVEIPFMVLTGDGAYVGPIAVKLQYVDISWIVGMLVAGTLYQKRFCAHMDLRTGSGVQMAVSAAAVAAFATGPY